MMIKEVIASIEQLAPRSYAEDFDNTGLLTGSSDMKVKGVLVTLDCLEQVVDEAIDTGCNLIVSFHPIIFSGLKSLVAKDYVSRAVVKAIKNDIAIYATHTALDNAKGGVSYRMGQAIGLSGMKTLIPKKKLIKKLVTYVPTAQLEQVQEALFQAGAGKLGNYAECSFVSQGQGTFKGNEQSNPALGERNKRSTEIESQLSLTFLPHLENQILQALHSSHPYEEVAFEITELENKYQDIGMGAIGNLTDPLETQAFLDLIKRSFDTGSVRYSHNFQSNKGQRKIIKTVAVLGGSGAFAINDAKAAGADAYVTADLKYHDFFQGERLLLCDVGHYESEQFTKNLLYEYLSEKFSNFAVLCAKARTNPVNYF